MPAAIDVDDVGTRDGDVDRQAAARVQDAADAPSALEGALARDVVERAEVERVADVEVVVAEVVLEVRDVPRVVAGGDGFVRAAGDARAVAERVLAVQGEPVRRTAREPQLHRVVAVVPAAGLVVDFSVGPLDAGDGGARAHRAGQHLAVRAGHDVELADLRAGAGAVGLHADRPVRDAPQEQVSALASDVGNRQRHVAAAVPAEPMRSRRTPSPAACIRSRTRAADTSGCSGC